MILKNTKIFSEGIIHKGAILINDGVIASIKFDPNERKFKQLVKKNKDSKEIDCQNKLVLPGIIDIHSHLRDMGQSEKETFSTGTKAAAFSGITTVFNMPNTIPPATTAEQVKLWMKKAQNNIYADVGFIAGVPRDIDEVQIKKIIELGILGFKIYPHNPLNEINWKDPVNLQNILNISSVYQIPIFIHAASPISDLEKKQIYENCTEKNHSQLEIHDKLNPVKMEENYVNFVINVYKKLIFVKKPNLSPYPIVHFCHISSIESYLAIQKSITSNKDLKISFEVTPHHLLLSNKIILNNDNYGKVLPPLRSQEHSQFLFNELNKGRVELIGTDHAPHTLEEKDQKFTDVPSGFPGFETYPLVIINKVFNYDLSLENFIKVACENPAKIFNLKGKGFIKEGYNGDLIVIDKINEYQIKSRNFKTKAKYSPFENYRTSVHIWKVFLRGIEINTDNSIPTGKVIKRML